GLRHAGSGSKHLKLRALEIEELADLITACPRDCANPIACEHDCLLLVSGIGMGDERKMTCKAGGDTDQRPIAVAIARAAGSSKGGKPPRRWHTRNQSESDCG